MKMKQLTRQELLKVIALKAAVKAMKGKNGNPNWAEKETIRWAEAFEYYLTH